MIAHAFLWIAVWAVTLESTAVTVVNAALKVSGRIERWSWIDSTLAACGWAILIVLWFN